MKSTRGSEKEEQPFERDYTKCGRDWRMQGRGAKRNLRERSESLRD